MGMPIQDACAELQRSLARLKRLAACNAKDAIFLSQVGLQHQPVACCMRCARSQCASHVYVHRTYLAQCHLFPKDICVMEGFLVRGYAGVSSSWLFASGALCVRACSAMQVKAKMAGMQRDLDRAQAASNRAHRAAHVRDKNDSWAKF